MASYYGKIDQHDVMQKLVEDYALLPRSEWVGAFAYLHHWHSALLYRCAERIHGGGGRLFDYLDTVAPPFDLMEQCDAAITANFGSPPGSQLVASQRRAGPVRAVTARTNRGAA